MPGTPDHQTAEKNKRPSDPKKYALIIAGVGGEEEYIKKFTALAFQLYDALTIHSGFDEKNVHLLTEAADSPENNPKPNSSRSTAAEVKRVLAAIKSSVPPDGLVAVFLIGHGSVDGPAKDGQQAKFNLLGPDLTAKDYAQLLGALPPARVIFVNSASASGEFIKPLSGDNRIVITATRSGNEQNATVFGEHFVKAITEPAADSDKNGRTSLLEAFNYATKVTADWYKQKDRLATEHALIDDNGDGAGHEQPASGDGALARTSYFDSKTAEQAGADTSCWTRSRSTPACCGLVVTLLPSRAREES